MASHSQREEMREQILWDRQRRFVVHLSPQHFFISDLLSWRSLKRVAGVHQDSHAGSPQLEAERECVRMEGSVFGQRR